MNASLRSFGIGLFVAGAALGIVQLTSKDSPDTQLSAKDTTTVAALEKENAALKKDVTALEKKLTQQKQQSAKKDNTPSTYTLHIESGMGTTEITNTLQKDGIISDARKFEQYIVDQGQATKLQDGSFTLQKDMSYADILSVLTD